MGLAVTTLCALIASQTSTSTAGVEEPTAGVEELVQQLKAQSADMEQLKSELYTLQDLVVEEQVPASIFPMMLFHGFFETGLQRVWMDQNSQFAGTLPSEAWSFTLGDAHLYLDVKPTPSWRSLLELRVNMSSGRDSYSATGGYTLVTSAERAVNIPSVGLGGEQIVASLILERAWVEYAFDEILAIRTGLWLTPFGIWNIDHGAPTLIASNPPYLNVFQGFPSHQIGLLLAGRVLFLPWQVAYWAGISNGRLAGPIAGVYDKGLWPSFDIDDSKMLSGRLEVSRRKTDHFAFGVSAYWGSTTSPNKELKTTPELRLESGVGTHLEEWGIDIDFRYDSDTFQTRIEAAYIEHIWHVGRPNFVHNNLYIPNTRIMSLYGLFAFPVNMPNFWLVPFTTIQGTYWPAGVSVYGALNTTMSLGINAHFGPHVLLKTEAEYNLLFDYTNGSLVYLTSENLFGCSLRLVVSF